MTHESQTRLVVNADGFGASPSISRGILRAHTDGVVTSTSIHGNTEVAIEEIVSQLRAHPKLGVGVQLVLITGQPVASRTAVGSLLGPHGTLLNSPRAFALQWAQAALLPEDIEAEMTAQVQRFVQAGLAIDHLDTFLHLACFPIVAEAMERVARRFDIPAMRTRLEDPSLGWFTDADQGLPLAVLGALSWFAQQRLGARKYSQKSWGYCESGNLGKMRIIEILGRLEPGIHEIICHPGEADDAGLTLSGRWRTFGRAGELDALTAPQVSEAIKRRDIALCRFSDLF